jgi:hypothetical protein
MNTPNAALVDGMTSLKDITLCDHNCKCILANALAVLSVLTGPTYTRRQSASLAVMLPVFAVGLRFSDRMPPSGYDRAFHDPCYADRARMNNRYR